MKILDRAIAIVLSISLIVIGVGLTVEGFHVLAAPAPPAIIFPLDCRSSAIQSGIPVRRLSDQKVTRVDVCGAADSSDDQFRDIKETQ